MVQINIQKFCWKKSSGNFQILKDNSQKDIWLFISAQGINIYQRGETTSHFGPQLYEIFEWKTIETLCYSRHYLCIIPHCFRFTSKIKKYKFRMDNKKWVLIVKIYFLWKVYKLINLFTITVVDKNLLVIRTESS